jgi:DNA polymerase-3 subunit epsilon
VSEADYGLLVRRVVAGLTVDPALLLDPLRDRMATLARAERFEDAAAVRDRAMALSRALQRQRRLDRLRRAGRVELELTARPDGPAGHPPRRLVLASGRLVDAGEGNTLALWARQPSEQGSGADAGTEADGPLPRHLVDELACVASWLDAEAHRIRLVSCDGELASALPRVPHVGPAKATRYREERR